MRRNKLGLVYIPVFVTVIVLVFIFSFFINTNNIQGAMNPPDKSYKTIIVYQHDTLWDIANTHMNNDYYNHNSYINEVVAINSIKGSTIYAGEELIIPVID